MWSVESALPPPATLATAFLSGIVLGRETHLEFASVEGGELVTVCLQPLHSAPLLRLATCCERLLALSSSKLLVLSYDETLRSFCALQSFPLNSGWSLNVNETHVAVSSLAGASALWKVTGDERAPLQPCESAQLPDACWSAALLGSSLVSLLPLREEESGVRLCVAPVNAQSLSTEMALDRSLFPSLPIHLVAVPLSDGLLVCLCEAEVLLLQLDASSVRCVGRVETAEVSGTVSGILPSAWAWAPRSEGDPFGRLALALDGGALMLLRVCGGDAPHMDATLLAPADGDGACSAIVWLPNGDLLCCTHGGALSLLAADGTTRVLRPSVAPLMDACLLPPASAGGRSYTLQLASGGAAGALHALRPGLACATLGRASVSPSFSEVSSFFPLGPLIHSGEGGAGLLLLSFAESSCMLVFSPDGAWEESGEAMAGLESRTATLLAVSLAHDGEQPGSPRRIVQVCSHALHAQPPRGASPSPWTWQPPAGERVECAAAAEDSGLLLLALAPSHSLYLLRLGARGWEAPLTHVATLGAQPSCLVLSEDGRWAAAGTYAGPGASPAAHRFSLYPAPALHSLTELAGVPHSLHFQGGALQVGLRTGGLQLVEESSGQASQTVWRLGQSPVQLASAGGVTVALAEMPGDLWLLRPVSGVMRLCARRLPLPDFCVSPRLIAFLGPDRLLLIAGDCLHLLLLPSFSLSVPPQSAPLLQPCAPCAAALQPQRCASMSVGASLRATLLAFQPQDPHSRAEMVALSPDSVALSECVRLLSGESTTSLTYWPEAGLVLMGTSLRAGGRLLVARLAAGEWEVVSEARLAAPVRSCAGAADGITLALAAGCLVHALLLLRPLRPSCPPLRLRGPVPALAFLPAPHGAPPLLALLDERDGVHLAQVEAGVDGRIALLASERRSGPAVALAVLPQHRLAVAERSGRVAIFRTDGLSEAAGPFRPTLRPLVVVELSCVPVRLCALPDGALYVAALGGSVHRIRPFLCTAAQLALLRRLENAVTGEAPVAHLLRSDALGSLLGLDADAQRRALQAVGFAGDACEAVALVETVAGNDCAPGIAYIE